MNDLLEYFYSHFKTEEEFSKQYGMFAPIVNAYVETLVAYNFVTTKEPLDRLLKTTVELVKEFSILKQMNLNEREKEIVNNMTGVTINKVEQGQLKLDTKMTKIEMLVPRKFDTKKNYHNLTLDEFLKNYELCYPTLEKANEKKDKFIKTLVHELNHAICDRKFVYIKDDKFLTDEKVLKEEDLSKLGYTEFVGGLRISNCFNGDVFIQPGADRIHEGITEFLAYVFMSAKPIKEIRYTIKKNFTRSYEPYPSLIEMYAILDRNLVFDAYFKQSTEKQKKQLKEIVDCQDSVFVALNKFKDLNDQSPQDMVDQVEDELISCVSQHVKNVFTLLQKSNIEIKKLERVCGNIYNFLKPAEWVEKAFDYANFKDKDHEQANAFAKKFKQFREEKMKEFETYAEECKVKTLKGDI